MRPRSRAFCAPSTGERDRDAVPLATAEGDNEVTLNPEVEYGLPAVRRVRTETILHRFLARESAEEIADDFGLEVASVEHALRYEWSLTRAA